MRGQRIGEAKRPGPPTPTHNPALPNSLNITRVDGSPLVLKASPMKGKGWRWQSGGNRGAKRLDAAERACAADALGLWWQKHAAEMAAESLTAIEAEMRACAQQGQCWCR